MTERRIERRLAAILAADAAGYSRLMGRNEEATHLALKAHLAELIEPCIGNHSGRVVKRTGDGVLAEFASVVDAARCAITVQKSMRDRNKSVADDQRLEFRIGVNLGDIIFDGDDIHGDGVNIAARLESLAEPGGVCLSGDAYRHARNRLEVDAIDCGEQQLKNIAEPVRIYQLRLDKLSVRRHHHFQ